MSASTCRTPLLKETTEERAERHEACKAFGKPLNTRFIRCAQHGRRGDIVDVYCGNLAAWSDADGWVCDETHPGCFDWFNAVAAPIAEPG